ncbi:MAG: hypothetical protein J6J24_01935 [Clostridia bacterium]|nr:hypothetical protein [Clostridia bacterium]
MAQYVYSKEILEKIEKFSGRDSSDYSLAKLSYHAGLAASVKKQIEQYQSFKNPTILAIALEKRTINSIEERVAHLDDKIELGKEILVATRIAQQWEKDEFAKYCQSRPDLCKKGSKKKTAKTANSSEPEKTLG